MSKAFFGLSPLSQKLLWSVATGQIGPAMRHEGAVKGAILTQDERRILSWSDDKTLRLWDMATGQQIGSAMRHEDDVRGAILTKDGRRILSWSDDQTLRLWDLETGQQVSPAMMRHDGRVNEATLTQDERHILSWSDDKTLRLWDVATGQQIGPAMRHEDDVKGAILTKDEQPLCCARFEACSEKLHRMTRSLRYWGHCAMVWLLPTSKISENTPEYQCIFGRRIGRLYGEVIPAGRQIDCRKPSEKKAHIPQKCAARLIDAPRDAGWQRLAPGRPGPQRGRCSLKGSLPVRKGRG
jgi:hypothetical protein